MFPPVHVSGYTIVILESIFHGSRTPQLTLEDTALGLFIRSTIELRIPIAAGHPFRFEPDTCSDFGRTLIPESPDTPEGGV